MRNSVIQQSPRLLRRMAAEPLLTGVNEPDTPGSSAEADEIKRLKAELRRVTEERDILKKATVH